MRFPPIRRLAHLVVLVVSILLAGACSSSLGDVTPEASPEGPTPPHGSSISVHHDASAGGRVTTDATPDRGPADDEVAADSTSDESTARALRAYVDGIDEPDPAVVAFVGDSSDEELITLAEDVCAVVEPDMSAAELGASVLVVHDRSRVGERLGADSFSGVFGALAGLHCPWHLPVSGQRSKLTSSSAPRADPIGGSADRSTLWPDAHPVSEFLADVEEQRLQLLAAEACAAIPVAASPTTIGLAALDQHAHVLSDHERLVLTAADHAELFGALIGWFCPNRLPTIG